MREQKTRKKEDKSVTSASDCQGGGGRTASASSEKSFEEIGRKLGKDKPKDFPNNYDKKLIEICQKLTEEKFEKIIDEIEKIPIGKINREALEKGYNITNCDERIAFILIKLKKQLQNLLEGEKVNE